jgi:hypothetical protein
MGRNVGSLQGKGWCRLWVLRLLFEAAKLKPFQRKFVKDGMSKYVVNPFANKALELAYAPEINDLNRRIVRRKELMKEFLRRSSDATTKKFKAMWKNLSKGHLYQKEQLEKERRQLLTKLNLKYIASNVMYAAAIGLTVGAIKLLFAM